MLAAVTAFGVGCGGRTVETLPGTAGSSASEMGPATPLGSPGDVLGASGSAAVNSGTTVIGGSAVDGGSTVSSGSAVSSGTPGPTRSLTVLSSAPTFGRARGVLG